MNFLRRRIVNAHLRYRDPQENLLALDACHLLHFELLHVRSHFHGVAHPGVGPSEEVLVRRLLFHPHEPSFSHSATLYEVLQGENALGESQLLQE